MRLVVIESPFGRNVDGSVASSEIIERNRRYLRACMADCLKRDEAPIASHALYTQPGVLDDSKPEEREKGMLAGWAWHRVAGVIAVYADLGITPGMMAGRDHAARINVAIETRHLGPPWSPWSPSDQTRYGWICSARCGWMDMSSHFERGAGEPCPGCKKPIEDIVP